MALLAAGCANPIPQYLSPRDTTSSIVTSALSQQRDGGCRGLLDARATTKADIAKAKAKVAAELARPAPNLSRVFERAFGPPGGGTDASDEARRHEARLVVLDHELAVRKCDGAPDAEAPPAVVREADAGSRPSPERAAAVASAPMAGGWAAEAVPRR